MKLTINASSCLVPPATEEEKSHALQPNRANGVSYQKYIQPRQLRRLSNVAKMGVYSAKACLAKAEKDQVDALLVATGTGGFAALDGFLEKMISQQEQNLSPVYFLQSLHSDVAGQIVLSLGIDGYTTTYTGRGSAFESTLLDAELLLTENPDQHILVGGADELPECYEQIIKQSGFLSSTTHTVGPGENAIFFSISKEGEGVCIEGCESHLGLLSKDVGEALEKFLKVHQIKLEDIEVVLAGFESIEALAQHFPKQEFKDNVVLFKQYCGEFPTSTAYGVWLGDQLLRGEIPNAALGLSPQLSANYVLVLNQYRSNNFSFILLSSNN